MKPSFFLIPLILTLILASVTHASIVPLEYKYSGSQVYPGSRVQVEMTAQAARWITGYSMAPVAVKVGDVEVAIEGVKSGFGVDVYFIVRDNGAMVDKMDLQDPGMMETRQYDLAVEIDWPCNSNTVTITVSGPFSKTYTLNPGDPPADIWYYSSRAGGIGSPGVESKVTVGGAQEYADCWNGGAKLPSPGDGSQAGGNNDSGNGDVLLYAGIGLTGLGILLMALRKG